MTRKALCPLLFAFFLALPAMGAPKVSTQTGPWHDTDTWGGAGEPGAGDDVFVASGHTVTIHGLSTKTINSLSVSGVLEHADNSTTEANKIILDIAGDCTVADGGRIDVSALGYNAKQGPGYGGSGSRGGSYGGRGWSGHATLYGETYGSITAPTNCGSGGDSTAGGGAVILAVEGETKVYGYIKANSGSGGQWNYAGAGGSVFLTTSNLVGTGTIEARSVATHFSGGGGRIAVVLTGSDSFGSVNMITYASQDLGADGAAGTVYLEKESDAAGQGELVVDQNNYTGNGAWAVTAMSDRDAVSNRFSRVTATNSGVLVVGSDDSLNLAGATLKGETNVFEGIIVDGGTLTVDSPWTLSDITVTIRSGSTFDVPTTLTVGSGGILGIDSSHTISGDVTVEDGGKISHTANSTTEAYRMDLTVGGDLQVDTGGAVDVTAKGYAAGNGPGYDSTGGGSYGGQGYDGTPGATYGSIVSPTNCGSGGSTARGGGAAILTVTGETRLYGYMRSNGEDALTFATASSGGSVYLTTSNLVGNGTIEARGGVSGSAGCGGGGRIAVVVTDSTSFDQVTMDASGGSGSSDGAAGTIYTRVPGQGPNEGTLIVDNAQNSSVYTYMGPLVTDKSVGDVIIRDFGKLKVGSGETLLVSGNWSNANVFAADTEGRVELAGTDTVTVFGSTTFGELVCTNVAKTINFEDGQTTAVDEILRFVGPSNTGLLLRSTSPGTQWLLDVDSGTTEVTVEYVDAKDSDARPDLPVSALYSKDSGNNSNWFFEVAGRTNWWTGASSTTWADNNNWSLGRPPAAFDGGVVISNNCDNYPTLPSEKTFPYFEMKNPSSLSLGGSDLTVENDAVIAGSLTATGTELLTFEQDVDFTSGTFTPAQSTVLLAGSGAQSMTSAGESCHSLTVTNSGRTVTFIDAVAAAYFLNQSVSLTLSGGVTATEFRAYTTDGSITQTYGAESTSTITDMYLLGATGKTNWLVSSSGGTKWNLDVDRIAYVKHANVEDSDASTGMTIYPIDSADTGPNNDNWVFTETWLTWDGSESSTFSAAANWTPETAPDATARVNIDGNGDNAPVLTANASVKEVLLGSEETSSLDLATYSLTVGENLRVMGHGTLTASRPSTIGNDVTVLDGGTITHNSNSGSSEANKLDLTIGGELQVDAGAEVNVNDKGYATKQGPGYVQYGASHGGEGNGQGPTYGSIVSPTNCGSGGSTRAGGGAAILTVEGEARVYGFIKANGTLGGQWNGAGAGGSVFLTTSNLVGTGTIEADGGASDSRYCGGGGRIAVHLTGTGSSFGSVEMTTYGGNGPGSDGAAGTVYKRSASQGSNEGTLIIDQPHNSAYYTSIDPLVTDASVGDVIIRNNGELKVETDQALQVSGNWSNANDNASAFVADTGGRVEFVGTDAATVFGSTTFKELVCTGVTKQINFEANQTTAVDEELIWTGPSDTSLVLRSTSPGDQWLLDVDSGITVLDVSYVDVEDSDARPDSAVTASTSIDSGNNSNWVFSVAGQTNWWTGGSSSTWTDNDNWSLGRPPSKIDGGVIFSNNCSYYTELPSDKTFGYFEMKDPSELSLGGYDLTVNDNAVIAGTVTATDTETLTFKGHVDFTSGTFTQAQSTVVLAGTDAQSMTSAGQSCYRLTVTDSGRTVSFFDKVSAAYFRNEAVSLAFSNGVTAAEFRAYTTDGPITQEYAAASTSTITDLFLLGAAGKTNWLVSSSSGTKWNLDVARIAYVKHANVEDSDADPGVTIYPVDSVDTGPNNDNWVFTDNWLTWDGSASSDFSAAANWTPETAPDATARVNIDGNGDNAPVLSSAASVLELLLGGDETSSLDLDEYSLTVGENLRVMSFGTLTANKPVTISNDLTLLDGGAITHAENTSTEANKINMTVGGDFYFGSTAEIDVDYKGYDSGGPGTGNGRGGSYGGQGGAYNNGAANPTYGSVLAPTNCGSDGAYDGGGAVQFTVTGETWLYGYIHANGEYAGSYSSGGSGGSIFLTTSSLVGNGTLEAEGGGCDSAAAGGGGRIAVVLTTGTSFDEVTMKVRGGIGNRRSQAFNGAPGTIYKQSGTDADGAGTVIVDCDGRAPDSAGDDSATTLPPQTLYVPNELRSATLVVTNDNTHMRLSTDLYVGDLLIYTNTRVTLTNMNLYVDKLEHHLDDATEKRAGGPTNAVDHYDQIIWTGLPLGSLLLLR